ncbi:hypothetical protein [Pseudomonas sp. FME51]|uniref:hypothetical protein n=1 Tax=Pseudomonas sp. FME51 TaxID=2742609 RepID=UPI00186684C8|nr:hypothetical protein [Pseudomonas sp. FME51]
MVPTLQRGNRAVDAPASGLAACTALKPERRASLQHSHAEHGNDRVGAQHLAMPRPQTGRAITNTIAAEINRWFPRSSVVTAQWTLQRPGWPPAQR